MAPTAPFCIEEAFKACQHQKRPSDRPIDIISVISHVDQPSDRLTILNVVDSSGKARIVYYGTQQQRRIVKTFGVTHGGMSKSTRLLFRLIGFAKIYFDSIDFPFVPHGMMVRSSMNFTILCTNKRTGRISVD